MPGFFGVPSGMPLRVSCPLTGLYDFGFQVLVVLSSAGADEKFPSTSSWCLTPHHPQIAPQCVADIRDAVLLVLARGQGLGAARFVLQHHRNSGRVLSDATVSQQRLS